MTRVDLQLAVVLLCACGTRHVDNKPAAPAFDVRAEIDEAEKAEKARRHDIAKIHYEKAVAEADRSKDPASISFARKEYAETLITWGEYPAAIQNLEIVVQLHPKDAGSWHDLGMLRHNQGDERGAIAALERARDLAPKDLRPRKSLAVLKWKLGDRAGAAAEYKQMLELDPPDRLREKIEWALRELAKPAPSKPADPVANPGSR